MMETAATDILIPTEVIHKRIEEIAAQISNDYEGKNPLIVGILNGAFIFMADLIRALSISCSVDFVRLASYGENSVSSGDVRVIKDLETPIAGRNVLLVEDIVDTGLTLSRMMEILREKKPASLKVCTLLDKRERRKVPFKADYVGFQVPNVFLVGYGLDYDEKFRFLPDVRVLKDIV